MPCWHKWEVIEKIILKSGIEQLIEHGQEVSGRGSLESLTGKPCIVHFKCQKCNAEKVRRI